MGLSYQDFLEKLSTSLWTMQEFNTMLQQYAESAALKSIALEITGSRAEKIVCGHKLAEQPHNEISLDSKDS